MSLIHLYPHDPDASLDYSLDWSEWLSDGETIIESTWSIAKGSATLSNSQVNASVTTTWLSDAAPPAVSIKNRIRTSLDRIDERTLDITVDER